MPISPGNSVGIEQAGLVAFDGSSVFTGSPITQHDILVGGASNAVTSVAPSATSGVAVISQGAAADPTFGTVVVAGGGTGATSLTGVVIGHGTSAMTASAVTQHDVLVGGASNAITSVAPSATSGVPLVSGGASADPSFTTAVVAGGGTGVTSFTDTNALLCSGTTTTGALQDVASVATGQVLISAGTSTKPSWSATPSVTSITLGGGTALGTYAEGTWTPQLRGSGTAGTPSYSNQSGQYRKIGKLVVANFQINASLSGATGVTLITGLPFTTTSASGIFYINPVYDGTGQTYATGNTWLILSPNNNATTANIDQMGTTKAATNLAVINGSQFWLGTFIYGTDS